MKNVKISKIFKTIIASVGVFAFFITVPAFATQTIGEVAGNLGDQSVGLTGAAIRIFGFIGIAMVGIAFIKGRTAKQQGEGIGSYVMMGMIGAVLLSIVTIVSVVNQSAFNTDASATVQGQIIQ